MGFWNDGIRSSSSPPRHDRDRTHSHAGSSRGNEHTSSRSESSKHYASRPSFARSASSFLSGMTGSGGGGGGGSSSRSRGFGSSSRARPRSGFIARIRKFLRDLYGYMRKHPVKVFFLVIMPLITGGALTKILATVGVRLPSSLQRMVGSQMGRNMMETQTRTYARGGARDFGAGAALPGMSGLGGAGGIGGSGIGVGDTIQSALGIAKMFM